MEKKKLFKGVYNWTFLMILIAAVIVVNVIAAFVYYRYDATEDKRYSLAEGTIAYLEDTTHFSDRVSIKIYLAGNLPAEVQRFKNAIEDKLKEFKQHAGSRIEYIFIDPLAGSESDALDVQKEIYAEAKGIIPMGLMYMKDGAQNQLLLWPGAEITYGDKKIPIQFLPGTPQGKFYTLNEQFDDQIQNSINNLEYILISGIRRTTSNIKPRVAFLQGHGELTFAQTQRARGLISPYYTVEDITLNDSVDALNGVKGLVIARPRSAFTEKDKYIIDQFVMNGGRLMCFVDKLYFPEDTLMKTGVAHTTRTNLDLDRMLFDYGIKANDNYVFDVRCAPKAVPAMEQGYIPWFFFVRSTQTSHPIARNIDPVLLKYTSEIEFVGNNPNAVAVPILTTSSNSAMTGLAPMISLGIPMSYGKNPKLAPDPENEENKLCIAGLVEGKFTSHFKNRIVSTYTENKLSNYQEQSTKEGKVLLVGNGSFLENKYDSVPDKMKGGYLYQPKAFNELKFDETVAQMTGVPPLVYGNQEFFQNMVDYMLGDNSVLDLRSKQIDIHAIDKEKVQADAGFYKVINMVLPSSLILIFAFGMLYLRKKRYTRN